MSVQHRIHERCACSSLSALASHELRLAGDATVALTEQTTLRGGLPAEQGRGFVLAGTERVYERALPFVVDEIRLDWTIDPAARSLAGTAVLALRRVDPAATELALDAVGLDIQRVSLAAASPKSGRRAAPRRVVSSYDGQQLGVAIPLPLQRFELTVRYATRPQRGLYFLAPDDAVPERPRQLWTQCQDEDARHLFPCHDKPHVRQRLELCVRVPAGWFALSNGEPRASLGEQRRGVFRYRQTQPIPSYLFTLVAGDFVCVSQRAGRVPLAYYVPRGRESDVARSFGRTPRMVRLFAERTGVPYPWGRYAQVVVHDFLFGGMENVGATTLYEHVLLDERAAVDIDSDDLIAHELAHQWFGDLVTCRDWSHGWLNEGFATFMEHVWREHRLGRDEYHLGLRDDLGAYLTEADARYQRPVVCADYHAPIDVFDRHLYDKGALVLHAVRCALGDGLFWRGVRRYLERHAGQAVETRDLRRAFEEVSGRSFEQAFEQWLERAGHPRLDVEIGYGGRLLTVTVKQTLAAEQPAWTIDLDLDVAPGGAKGSTAAARALGRRTVRVTKPTETFAFPAPDRPRFVVVDAELRVVGRVSTKAPLDMLRAQLRDAPTGRGRALAAEALGRHSDPATVRELAARLADRREFWGVRVAAATALGNVRSPVAYELLRGALRVRHSKVRRGVVTALGRFRSADCAATLAKVARRDPSLLVGAAASRALGATRDPSAYDELVALTERASWADVLRAGAIEGLAELRDERGVELLRKLTRYGVPTRSRRAAIGALAKLSTERPVREHLEELLDAETPSVRATVVEALVELGDVKSRGPLSRALEREHEPRVRRRLREALRDLGGKGKQDLRRLREELEELRRQHGELSARLAKVEAQAASAGRPRRPR